MGAWPQIGIVVERSKIWGRKSPIKKGRMSQENSLLHCQLSLSEDSLWIPFGLEPLFWVLSQA